MICKKIKYIDFKLNSYYICVLNKEIYGKKCTVAWYVNGNKLSHMDPSVNEKIIEYLRKIWGGVTVTRGKKHIFLGMNITI